MAEFSWDEVAGKPAAKPTAEGGVSWSEAAGKPATKSNTWIEAFKGAFKEIPNLPRSAAGNVAVLADMIVSIPGFLTGIAANAGARGMGVWGTHVSGDSRQDTVEAGRRIQDAVSKYTTNPIHAGVTALGRQGFYENSDLGSMMQKLTEVIEKSGERAEAGTGGTVRKGDVQLAVDAAMMVLPPLASKAFSKLKPAAREPLDLGTDPGVSAPKGSPPPAPERMPLRDLAEHYKQTIDEVTAPAVKRRERQAMMKEAFDKGVTDAGLTLRQQQFRAEESGRQSLKYEAEEAARVAADNETRGYELKPGEEPTVTQSDVLRVMQKPPFERTAEDLLTLREARNKALVVGGAGASAAALATLADDSDDFDGAMAAVGGLGIASGRGFRSPYKQIGAVKLPGGIWHPEAVERLSSPLRDKLLVGDERVAYMNQHPEAGPRVQWADKAVKNYLNRYAGTERDPLKDIEIPFETGIKKWGELMDTVAGSVPAKNYKEYRQQTGKDYNGMTPEALAKIPETEAVWGLEGRDGGAKATGKAVPALKNYLSHVGDYLRQNVDPAKLQQYDLPRAVRETSLNDARVAREMEKAQATQMANMPVHKVYDDGFKWVELKLLEKLTAEQAKGVAQDSGGWVAIDSKGKNVRNSFTGDNARGATAEEAWLAGRLAEEGNAMGHCVGGYCESVASGESKIYSLRDAKGNAHVTIETAPVSKTALRTWRDLKEGVLQGLDDVLQIKGKQNRAPAPEYQPYVQDFVKGGKWGEVGDMMNAGLIEIPKGPAPFSPEAMKFFQERFGDERFTTDAEWQQARKDFAAGKPAKLPPKSQQGSASTELLTKVAAIGGGAALLAALDDQNPESAAVLGGLLGFAGTKIPWSKGVATLDKGLGIVSTRIGNISEAVKHRMVDFERHLMTREYENKSLGDPFFMELNKLPKPQQAALNRALLTNDPAEIRAQIDASGSPRLAQAWGQVNAVLTDLGGQLESAGRIKLRDDYFPRVVSDLPGLLKELGTSDRQQLEGLLATAEKRAERQGHELSQLERSKIVNDFLLNPMKRGAQPGWSKSRRVQEITERLEPFYLNATDSFHSYIHNAVLELEKARLFGKDAQHTKRGDLTFLNEDASIGALVDKEVAAGRMDGAQAKELRELLRSRFQGGERASGQLVQGVKNLSYMGLLSNGLSALVQLGDPIAAVRTQGLMPTVEAVARTLTGNAKLSMKDFGLKDNISTEFVTTSETAKWVNNTFKWSGFSAVDAFGKNTILNAAKSNFEKMAQTSKGQLEIGRKYEAAFGPDFPQLLKDLQAKQLTDNTMSLYFHELSDMQPVSKLEMPQAYLDNPNGRLLYALKSFTLKQIDQARRDVYNEFKEGNVARGTKNLAALTTVLGIAGATTEMLKNFVLGRDFDASWEDIPMNALKTMGWSQYVLDKVREGKPVAAIGGVVLPPYQMFDDIVRRDPKAISYLPVVGKLAYEYSDQGEEAAAKRSTRQKLKEIDREILPLFGKPSEEQKLQLRERKRELRESLR